MGATIEGKGRVFAKEHDGWTSFTLGISSKNTDGKWVNAYQPIRFRKNDMLPQNGADIEYTAFPVVKEKTEEGKNRNYIIWQILDWKTAVEEPEVIAEPKGFTALDSADIPF